jgi:hypothetical protein
MPRVFQNRSVKNFEHFEPIRAGKNHGFSCLVDVFCDTSLPCQDFPPAGMDIPIMPMDY